MNYKITGSGKKVTDTFQARNCDVSYAQIYYEELRELAHF